MTIIHSLLSAAYPPLKLLYGVKSKLSNKRSGKLRVLLYHDIPPWEESRFAEQLEWLSRFWRFVDPKQFADMVTGKIPVKGRNLLLTFDDGFASNRKIADRILKPMGIKALFFVISELVSIDDYQYARSFIAKNLFPGRKLGTLPKHCFNMNWKDLQHLLDDGHLVGAHTCTHCRLSETKFRYLEREIIGSADLIESKLGISVEHFAFTFGNLESFNKEALAIARRRFKFIHTGMRGNNAMKPFKWAIRRDAISLSWPMWTVGSFIEGGTDLRYAKDLARYESWGSLN